MNVLRFRTSLRAVDNRFPMDSAPTVRSCRLQGPKRIPRGCSTLKIRARVAAASGRYELSSRQMGARTAERGVEAACEAVCYTTRGRRDATRSDAYLDISGYDLAVRGTRNLGPQSLGQHCILDASLTVPKPNKNADGENTHSHTVLKNVGAVAFSGARRIKRPKDPQHSPTNPPKPSR